LLIFLIFQDITFHLPNMAISIFLMLCAAIAVGLSLGAHALPDPRSEIVVMLHQSHVNSATIQSSLQQSLSTKYGANVAPLFDLTMKRSINTSNLRKYLRVESAKPQDFDNIIKEIRTRKEVQTAYISPPPSRPFVIRKRQAPENPTPLFTDLQGYLRNATLGGFDVDYSSGVPGGSGDGIKVFDIEGAWLLTHEDLQVNDGGVIGTNNLEDPGDVSHGTAVAGIIGGDYNTIGIDGMAPNASFYGSSDIFATYSSAAQAIQAATAAASPGDVILLEEEQAWNVTSDTKVFLPIEWWPHNWDVIKAATDAGIVVVEAAGNGEVNGAVNGGQDLNSAVLNATRYNPLPPYDANGTDPFGNVTGYPNPFLDNSAYSGAVLVGAGVAGPSSTTGMDRVRLGFSNYGSRLDVQAWGEKTFTTGSATACDGYGTPGLPESNRCYNEGFSGTSGASAIITGVVASVQGALKAQNLRTLTSAEFNQLFRSDQSGDPQVPSVGDTVVTDRIGNRPDLSRLIPLAIDFVNGKAKLTSTSGKRTIPARK
jgi:hypothetical protein